MTEIKLNRQYELSGLKSFKIDAYFDPLESVQLSGKPNYDVEMEGSTRAKTTSFNEENGNRLKVPRKDSYLSAASKSTANGSSDQLSSEDGSANRIKEASNFTKVMHERWLQSNSKLPHVDQKDIFEEHPIFNNGKKKVPDHQHHPEFTQTSYLRLRSLEEAFLLKNYFEVPEHKKSTSITHKITKSISSLNEKNNQIFREEDRSYGIQKIFDLHTRKDYKVETLFIAAGIFDRYINLIGWKNFPRPQVLHLATICVLMSAKLEQPISPSFTRMINCLPEDERKYVTKSQLIDLEANILVQMGFEFNFPGPIQSMERYLRILGYDLNSIVYDMAFQICKF